MTIRSFAHFSFVHELKDNFKTFFRASDDEKIGRHENNKEFSTPTITTPLLLSIPTWTHDFMTVYLARLIAAADFISFILFLVREPVASSPLCFDTLVRME